MGPFFPSLARVSGCTGQDGPWQRPGVFRASGDDLRVRTYLRRCAALVLCEAQDQGRARSFIFKILRRIYVGHLARTLTKSPLRACPQKRGGDRPFSWPVTPPCPALPSSLKKLQGQHSGKGGCPHGAVPAGRSRASRGWRHGGLVYLLAEP